MIRTYVNCTSLKENTSSAKYPQIPPKFRRINFTEIKCGLTENGLVNYLHPPAKMSFCICWDFLCGTLLCNALSAMVKQQCTINYSVCTVTSIERGTKRIHCLLDKWLTSDQALWCTVYPVIYKGSLGKIEHGGKMEYRVFGKWHTRRRPVFTSTWFLSSASSVSYIEIKLAINHVFISQKRSFTFLIIQFTHALAWLWLIKLYNRCMWYDTIMCLFFAFSHQFDWATGNILVDMMRFL